MAKSSAATHPPCTWTSSVVRTAGSCTKKSKSASYNPNRARKRSSHVSDSVSVPGILEYHGGPQANDFAGIFLGISLAAVGGVLFGLIHGINMGSSALAFTMLTLLFITGICAVGTMVSLGSETDPEKIVESELQACLRKHSES